MFSLIFDVIFPKRCVGCNTFGSYYCRKCVQNSLQKELICPMCGKNAMGGQTHPVCKRKFGMDGLWTLGIYQGTLRQSILQLKYHFVTGISKELVNIIIEYWAKNSPFVLDKIKKSSADWVVTAVPLHWYKENNRGFNQSELLGQQLADILGIPYQPLLKRISNTKSQTKLDRNQRRQNIKGAFELQEKTPGFKVLLIDDVWTTGSTMKECSYILKRSGIKEVWGITLAR